MLSAALKPIKALDVIGKDNTPHLLDCRGDSDLIGIAFPLICYRAEYAQASKLIVFSRGQHQCRSPAGLFTARMRIKVD